MMSMKKSLNTSALVTADSPKGKRATETFRAKYKKAELTDERAQYLNEHPGFATYLATGIRRFSVKMPRYAVLSRSILGADFITPEEVVAVRPGIVYTTDQIRTLVENRPSLEVLAWCNENAYAVMPAPPVAMSMLDIRAIKPRSFYSKEDGRYAGQKFAHEDKTSFGWLMIKRTCISRSKGETWENQNRLLSRFERVPNVAEMSWFITTYFEVCSVHLFKGGYVRTSSLSSAGRVAIGAECFVSGGIDVYGWKGDKRNDYIGLSAAWKQ